MKLVFVPLKDVFKECKGKRQFSIKKDAYRRFSSVSNEMQIGIKKIAALYYGIRQLIWQGDTQILSLTPGAQANSAEGWTLIMPDWQNGEGASNHWRLSVVVEDNQGQRVSSNEITLTLVEPFDALSNDELRWEP